MTFTLYHQFSLPGNFQYQIWLLYGSFLVLVLHSGAVSVGHEKVHHLSQRKNITFTWIPGHTDIPGNDRAEGLAKAVVNMAGVVQLNGTLHDQTVEIGGDVRFLCVTKVKDGTRGNKLSRQTEVIWKFKGQNLRSQSEKSLSHLSLGPLGQVQDHYTFKTYENRHVLTINNVRADDEGVYTCEINLGSQQAHVSAKLTVLRSPDPPLNVTRKTCVGNSALVTWSSSLDHGTPITSYLVQYNLAEEPNEWYDSYEFVPGNSTQAYVKLQPWGTYRFRVRASNAIGMSDPSAITDKACTTPPDRPDRNPTHVITRTDKKGYLVIEWKPLHRLSFNGPGFRYLVLWRRKRSLAWNAASVNGSYAQRFEHKVNDIYAEYEFKVKSDNEFGQAHQPGFVYVGRSFEAEPQVVVTGFKLEQPVTLDRAVFSWDAVDPKHRLMHGKFRGYKLIYWEWDTGERNKSEVLIPYSDRGDDSHLRSQTVYGSIPNLPAYSTIKVQVVVVNTHYQGPPSNTIDIFTPESIPGPVLDLKDADRTFDSITLRWLYPERPNGIIIGYIIEYQEVLFNGLGQKKRARRRDNKSLQRTERVSGLQPNTIYRFMVCAVTKMGRGNASIIESRTSNTLGPNQSSKDTSGSRDNTKLEAEDPEDIDNGNSASRGEGSSLYKAHNGNPESSKNSATTLRPIRVTLIMMVVLENLISSCSARRVFHSFLFILCLTLTSQKYYAVTT